MQKNLIIILCCFISFMHGAQQAHTYHKIEEPILKSSLPSLETMKKRLCDAKNADDFKDFFDKAECLQKLLADSDDSVTLEELTNFIVPDLFQNYYGADIINEDDAIPLIEKGLPIIMQCIVPNINQDIVNKAIHNGFIQLKNYLH